MTTITSPQQRRFSLTAAYWNLDLIDKYKETDNKLDREKLVEAILKDFYGYNRQTMNDYLRFKNEKDNPK